MYVHAKAAVDVEGDHPLDVKLKASGLIARVERANLLRGAAAMADPGTAAAGGAAAFKLAGGAAGMAAGGAGLAAIIVMLMTPPRSAREWTVGLISTVMGSIGGGAFVVQKFGLQDWMHTYTGLVAIMGLCFACGLPAWSIVRWAFTWMIQREGKPLDEVISDARKVLP
jgi:hypothetical protein